MNSSVLAQLHRRFRVWFRPEPTGFAPRWKTWCRC